MNPVFISTEALRRAPRALSHGAATALCNSECARRGGSHVTLPSLQTVVDAHLTETTMTGH